MGYHCNARTVQEFRYPVIYNLLPPCKHIDFKSISRTRHEMHEIRQLRGPDWGKYILIFLFHATSKYIAREFSCACGFSTPEFDDSCSERAVLGYT